MEPLMPNDPPPRPFSWAYALAAFAIWAMAAYGFLVPKPSYPVWTLAAAGQACAR
jgi:hypothetical protein